MKEPAGPLSGKREAPQSRGATWEEIGVRLGGLSKTATQKRFGQGLRKDARRRLAVEKTAHRLAFQLFLDKIPDGAPRALSEEDWDAAPPAVAIPYALRNLIKTHRYLEDATDEQGRFGVEGFSSGFDVLRQSVNILLSPNALSTIESTWERIENRRPWYDENPNTYFIHCGCMASASYFSFYEFITCEDSFSDEGLHYYAQGLLQLGDAITAAVRPELVLIRDALDLKAQEEGHAVYARNDHDMSADVGRQVFDAYWRGDENAMEQLEAQVGSRPERRPTTRP
ncbi:hypothetical protein EDC02_7337 [Micromonospora sp. Llam0]|uniref:hypothetical protein n=1 Tax=Micromonospora sp. Llam0 TaxID=2485143 RepID=UPI000FBADE5C|nr:hypothetical protein [Micromonospora sp. Llam0]ROO52412.1 hypothetical protein EDC02_7337 [Micromonospora sp. Llam0]